MRRLCALIALLVLLPRVAAGQSVILGEYRPGQKTMAGSLPVTLASNQTALPVTVSSLPLPTGAATESTLTGILTTSAFQARIPVSGQGTMAASIPVVLASNQSAIPVSQSGTWTIGTLTTITNVVHVDDNAGSLTVDNGGTFAVQAAQTGTWTVQPGNTANTTPWLIDARGPAAHDAAATGNPLLLGGYASSTVPVAVTASGDITRLWAGLNGQLATMLVDASGNAVSVGGGTQYDEDTAHASGDKVTMAGVLQQAADAAMSTDGDRSVLQVDASGFLKVNVKAGGAAGGTSSNIGSAVPTPATYAGYNDGTNLQGARVVDADTGAGTVYTLLTNLVRRASGGPTELIGSSTSANSLPVVIASDQGAVTVTATNLSTNVAQLGGVAIVTGGVAGVLSVGGNVAHDGAMTANPIAIGGYASAAAPTSVSADGDVVRAWYIRNGSAAMTLTAAGALIGGDATNGLDVDVTRVSGTVTVDSEMGTAAALAEDTANPTIGGVASFNMCFDGTTWDRCRSSTTTEATHDGALTAGTTVGGVSMLIAKDQDGAALPNVVTAEGDAVIPAASLFGVQYVMAVNEDGSTVGHIICDSGCSGGTTDADDASIATGQTIGLSGALHMVYDGTVWRRATIGTAGTASAQVTTVQGIASMTPLLVTLSGANPVTNAGTFVVQENGAALTALQLIDNLPNTLGSTTSGQSGALALGAVTTAAPTYTTAQSNALSLQTDGSLRTAITNSVTLAALPAGSNNIGDVDVLTVPADPFGANADAASATGSISAKLRFIANTGIPITGTVTVGSHAVTNAGTFATQESQVIADDAAFTAGTSKLWAAGFVADEAATDSVNEDDLGAARMTLDRVLWSAPAAVTASTQASSGCYLVSAASTNATNCKASAGNLYGLRVVNTTTTTYYLRLYNTASAPTCSSATGFIESVPIPPASAAGQAGGIVWAPTYPINYATGLSFCFTGGSSSTDNTNAATGVFGVIQYK